MARNAALNPQLSALLEALDQPLMLVSGQRIVGANQAAQALLGAHIVGQDARLALRHPDFVAMITGDAGGHVSVPGLSTTASLWDVGVSVIGDNLRVVALLDRSAQADVSRSHTDFVANASHELRTPLAAIIGYVETLMEPKAGAEAATRERFLGIVRKEASRLQRLVEDLMSLSRIEAERHDPPQTALDLGQLASTIVKEIEAAGDSTSLIKADTAANVKILGDAPQLTQLVRNLLDNAAKYAGDKPIAIRVERNAHDRPALSVADEGEGISPEHLPRLTERFYRVDAARSRAAGGTGLGLAIVKHIVQRHRGQLDIRSVKGAGTTVTVSFPPI